MMAELAESILAMTDLETMYSLERRTKEEVKALLPGLVIPFRQIRSYWLVRSCSL